MLQDYRLDPRRAEPGKPLRLFQAWRHRKHALCTCCSDMSLFGHKALTAVLHCSSTLSAATSWTTS